MWVDVRAHVSAESECRGYKGVFVTVRATPVFSETFGLGREESSHSPSALKPPSTHMHTSVHVNLCIHLKLLHVAK